MRFQARFAASALALLCLLASSGSALAKAKTPATQITSEIICPCSCGEVLSGCTCDTGKSMQAYVETSLKQGKSKEQIVGALVAQYGEVIRGAPKPQGFNLLVWVAPFAATLAGFVIAFWILRRWSRREAAVPAGSPGAAFDSARRAELEVEALRARAEAELRRLKE